MTKRILHILAAVLSVCLALGALDLSGVTSLFPAHVAQTLTILPPIFMAVGHSVLAIGDQLDDGEKNNSFPGSLRMHPGTVVAALLLPSISCMVSAKLAIIALGLLAIVWFVPRLKRQSWLVAAVALVCCLTLPSCTTDAPFSFSLSSPETGMHGSYSSKGGVSVWVSPPRAVIADK